MHNAYIYMTFPCFVVFSILTINKKNRGRLQREMVKNKTKESKSKKNNHIIKTAKRVSAERIDQQ